MRKKMWYYSKENLRRQFRLRGNGTKRTESMTNLLMILDGYGHNDDTYGNAVKAANQPFIQSLFDEYPHTLISASGLAVGLPEGQMGNSEVGHMNMGAGRIVYQELTRISKAIDDGAFFENEALVSAMDRAKKKGRSLHLLGLVSDGGVHSHMKHIEALIAMAKKRGVKRVFLHAFLDGRDVPPKSAAVYFREIEAYMEKTGVGRIASIAGRYYPMDRDKRWERVEKGYDCLTLGVSACKTKARTARGALRSAYLRGETDEFVLPTFLGSGMLGKRGEAPEGAIRDGDSLVFFDFRPDRMRQIVRSFADPAFDGFERKAVRKDLTIVCMTQYDVTIPRVTVAFPPETHKNTFGEYVSKLGKTQLRIAETEKYAHVTFFFNGGVEAPNPGEDRILVPSPKVATYDLQPEMSAPVVAEKTAEAIRSGKYDFVILNFANPDMVGHTGNFKAVVQALEALDGCVRTVVTALREVGGNMILTADHGNCDVMLDAEGKPVTSHSTNPVPFLVMRCPKRKSAIVPGPLRLREGGRLCDVVPTLLNLAGILQPAEMTGVSLIRRG